MRKTYCSVCGKMMNEKIDENSGKPFKIQMCSVSCISEAWHNVTEALKKVYVPNGCTPATVSNRNHSHEVTINGIYTIIELWFYKIKGSQLGKSAKN